MTNTAANIGVSRMCYNLTPPAERNFEPGGTTAYVSNTRLTIRGTVYNVGDALPLGILPDETLEVLFNAGEISPAA
jgi:hypothetical protein